MALGEGTAVGVGAVAGTVVGPGGVAVVRGAATDGVEVGGTVVGGTVVGESVDAGVPVGVGDADSPHATGIKRSKATKSPSIYRGLTRPTYFNIARPFQEPLKVLLPLCYITLSWQLTVGMNIAGMIINSSGSASLVLVREAVNLSYGPRGVALGA